MAAVRSSTKAVEENIMKFAILPVTAGALLATAAFAQQSLPLGHFDSVSATDGADVSIHHGAMQQVTILHGDAQTSRIEVRNGTLEIATCRYVCPWHYELKVAIAMPNLKSVSADDGANIRAEGAFPAQATLTASADDGGDIDLRAIPATHADAKANDGGEIRVRATASLNATAGDGGNITYSGKPALNMHSDDGGQIDSEGD
jgi:Putative auto-transporter adhesin, head GIN domain